MNEARTQYLGNYTAFDVASTTGYPVVDKLYIEKKYWGYGGSVFNQPEEFKKGKIYDGDLSGPDSTWTAPNVITDEPIF
jgi:hypothetical protein